MQTAASVRAIDGWAVTSKFAYTRRVCHAGATRQMNFHSHNFKYCRATTVLLSPAIDFRVPLTPGSLFI
jgi:hypothetical protein